MLRTMNKIYKRSLRTPGLHMSGQCAATIATTLQEAAVAEEAMDDARPQDSVNSCSFPALSRQNAIEEPTKPLHRQSKSDPTIKNSTYVFNVVRAVQESGGVEKFPFDLSNVENEGLLKTRCQVMDGDGPGFSTDANSLGNNFVCRALSTGVLPGKHDMMSASTTSSYFLTSSNVGTFTLDKLSQPQIDNSDSPDEQLRLKCSDGPFKAHYEEEPLSFTKDTCPSYLDSIDVEIMRQLETSARCHDSSCLKCAEMRKYMTALQDPAVSIQSSSKEEKILINMHAHCFSCALSRCPFYWCGDILPKQSSCLQEIVAVMKQRVEHYVLDPFIGNAKLIEFVKLHIDYPEFQKEDHDWISLTRLGHSRNTVFALPTKQDLQSSLNYWVIKKVLAPREDGASEKLYRQLMELKHPGIVHHLWAASFTNPEMFVICTKYEDVSLQEVVQAQPIQSLSVLVNLMLKLIAILEYLHRQGILFLNWSGSNVLTDQTLTKVKLADFTASTLKEDVEDCMPELDAYLPVHLQPPELWTRENLTEKSDVWGLGCLLHEAMTGNPVWHQYKHESLEGLRKKMRKEKRPIIPTNVKELNAILMSCFQFEMAERPILDELKQLFIQASIGLERRASSTINFYQMTNT